jgi:hypothetical protein
MNALNYISTITLVLMIVVSLNFALENLIPKSDIEIEAEYFSGLLGATSVVIAFSTWVINKVKKHRELLIGVFLFGPLFALMVSIGRITNVALGHGNPEATLYWLSGTLAVTLFILINFTIFITAKKIEERNLEN